MDLTWPFFLARTGIDAEFHAQVQKAFTTQAVTVAMLVAQVKDNQLDADGTPKVVGFMKKVLVAEGDQALTAIQQFVVTTAIVDQCQRESSTFYLK